MFDGRWRSGVDSKTAPIGSWLQRHGITADVLTATGLISATLTAIAVGTGHFYIAIALLTLTGMHDLFDGPVAKAAGTTSVRGAFFDSVTDRVADALLMGGVAWYLISAGKGHLAVLPLAILGVTALVSYERAKAESLGLSAKGGLMERAERMILLGIGFLATWLLVPVLWIMLVLTTATAIGRFVKVWNEASGKTTQRATPGRAALVEARLKEWRAMASAERRASRDDAPLNRWRARRADAPGSRPSRSRRTRTRRSSHSAPRG